MSSYEQLIEGELNTSSSFPKVGLNVSLSKLSDSAWLECAMVQISLDRVMVRKVSFKFQQTLKKVPNFGKNRERKKK
jgi:hypothetical protein